MKWSIVSNIRQLFTHSSRDAELFWLQIGTVVQIVIFKTEKETHFYDIQKNQYFLCCSGSRVFMVRMKTGWRFEKKSSAKASYLMMRLWFDGGVWLKIPRANNQKQMGQITIITIRPILLLIVHLMRNLNHTNVLQYVTYAHLHLHIAFSFWGKNFLSTESGISDWSVVTLSQKMMNSTPNMEMFRFFLSSAGTECYIRMLSSYTNRTNKRQIFI